MTLAELSAILTPGRMRLRQRFVNPYGRLV